MSSNTKVWNVRIALAKMDGFAAYTAWANQLSVRVVNVSDDYFR
ncbi:MAG: hypothetical protein ACQZ3N_07365 [cyanobacterium endosymbiont of Rhopalodia yunnanensis]